MFEVRPTTQQRRALRKIYRDFQECIWNMNIIMTGGVLLVSITDLIAHPTARR